MNNEIWNPTVEEITHSGIREVSLRTKMLSRRTIYLNGEITDELADVTIMQLNYLSRESDEPITLVIHSQGGSVCAGLMIVDVIDGLDVEINIVGIGLVASMAAVIMACGKPGHRFMFTHSQAMIHEPMLSGGVGGSASSIKNLSDSIMNTRATINAILAEHTGRAVDEVDKATTYDNYMTAAESVEFGLVDKIIKSFEEVGSYANSR